MSFIELFLLAIGLSMDAFAVAICIGLALDKSLFKKALIVGLYFGIFQALMPLIGFLAASLFADAVINYSHFIAFALLAFIGGKMVTGSFKKEDGEESLVKEYKLGLSVMLPLAFATSIDALAVGVSFAFLNVRILPAVILIGLTTLVISMGGVKIGNAFGVRFKSKAELAGGIILILIGLRILLVNILL